MDEGLALLIDDDDLEAGPTVELVQGLTGIWPVCRLAMSTPRAPETNRTGTATTTTWDTVWRATRPGLTTG